MQKVISDTSIDGHVCGACHGSGLYVGHKSEFSNRAEPIIMQECVACAGTGTCKTELMHDVLLDLGKRTHVYPDYADPINTEPFAR